MAGGIPHTVRWLQLPRRYASKELSGVLAVPIHSYRVVGRAGGDCSTAAARWCGRDCKSGVLSRSAR